MSHHDNRRQQQQTPVTTAEAAASLTTEEEQPHHTRTPEEERGPTTCLGRRRRGEPDEDEANDGTRERRARRAQERRQRREEEVRRRERAIAARQAEEIEQFLQQPAISARLVDMANNGIDPEVEEERTEAMSRRYNDLIQEQQATGQHPLLAQQRCREYRVDQRMDQRLADFGLISLARMARNIRCRNVLECMQDLKNIVRRSANTPAATERDRSIRQVAGYELVEHAFGLTTVQPGDDLILSGQTLSLRDEVIRTMPRFQRILNRQVAEREEPRAQRHISNCSDDERKEQE